MGATSYILAIGGGTGAGKTTVANEIAEAVDSQVTILSLDNYYRDRSDLSFDERVEINYDHPDAFEWELMVADLNDLRDGNTVQMPQYDFETHTRKDERTEVRPTAVIILEGIYALYHDDILEGVDLPIYVQTDSDVRVLRRLERDVSDRGREVDDVIEQYLSTVKPMHEQFIEPTKRNADIIVPEGTNRTAVELFRDKIDTEREAISTRSAQANRPLDTFE